MTQGDMNRLAVESRKNRTESIMMLTIMDPIFADEIVRHFNSGEYGSYWALADAIQ